MTLIIPLLWLTLHTPSRAEQSASILARCACASRVEAPKPGIMGPDRPWWRDDLPYGLSTRDARLGVYAPGRRRLDGAPLSQPPIVYGTRGGRNGRGRR